MTTKHTRESSEHANEAATKVPAVSGKEQAASEGYTMQTLQEGIAGRLAGLNSIEADIVTLVKNTVSDTLKTGGGAATQLTKVIHDVVEGAIGATEQVGTGLTMSTKSVAKGIVMGVHEVNGDVIGAGSETLRSVIHHAAAIGADVGLVAKRAMNGIIEGVSETGGNVGQAASRATEGAIEEAGRIGNMAVKTVKDVLIGIGDGVGEVLGKMLPHAPSHPAAQHHAASAPGKAMHS
ncbi:hypothetical protein [Noviherbaspirillum autotrophicum]|uniref:hypothetical protein n=1 Tax=Noviherbaspirillum autotrophicum TaxID=709839 RepID=UPI000694EA2B|nr:hypothetical protein [Noviherbaspirillum autotrophicum]